MITILGWAGTVIVLGTYAYTANTGKTKPFHVGNVVGAMLLGATTWGRVWPAFATTATFGVLGLVGLIRGR